MQSGTCGARAIAVCPHRVLLTHVLVLVVAALLSACAIKPRSGDVGWRPVADTAPDHVDTFRLAGRLAVSDGKDGGSAGFLWSQRGDAYEFELRQPVSQRTWRLTGDARGAVLEGGDDGPRRGESAEMLLSEMLGWQVPFGALGDWVRGLPGDSAVVASTRDARGRLELIEQAGWRVEFRAWLDDGVWPTRLTARRGPYSVRLSIQDWAVGE